MRASDKAVDGLLDELMSEEWEISQAALANLEDEELYNNGRLPVDIVQFCEDNEFLGGQVIVEPQVMQLLYELEEPNIREGFVEVGKGSGKSLVGSIFPVYGVYKLLSMKKPQLFYGLAPATIIAFINVSINSTQAKEVIFHQIKQFISKSPWFDASTKFQDKAEELKFDGNVTLYCGHSNSTAFLGFATMRAVMDESNYMINNANIL